MKLSLSLDIAGAGTASEPIALFRDRCAQIEAARPDFVILAHEHESGQIAPPRLEALVNSAWITGIIKTPCVVAGLPGLHSIPFHVARALSAIDFLSEGRAGWMPLTAEAARFDAAYGATLAGIVPAEAVARQDDFIHATQALWDSWDDDALILNKESGEYLDSTKVRRVNYRGPFYSTMGPLNAARPPQGYPLLFRDADAIQGSRVPADVAIGSLEALADADAAIRLLKVAAASSDAIDGALAAVAAGTVDGLHLYGPGALDALQRLDRAPPSPASGLSSRAAHGLVHPVNAYAKGAVL